MRPLPAETIAQLEALRALLTERPSPWRRSRWIQQCVKAIAQIAIGSDWRALPYLAWQLDHPDNHIAVAAARAVATLLPRMPISRLPDLDRMVRGSGFWRWSTDHGSSPIAQLEQLHPGPWVLCVATLHPSGYVREAAIKRLAVHHGSAALPYLLWRLNDWVAQVRRAAGAVLRARLNSSPAEFIALLPLVDRLRAGGRIDDMALLDEIDRRLASPDTVPAMRAAMHDRDVVIRRAVFRRSFAGDVDRGVLAMALADLDPAIRRYVVQQVEQTAPALLAEVAATLLHDRTGQIRMIGLQTLLERRLEAPIAELLWDRHAGVRALAQAQAVLEDRDPASSYRVGLDSARGQRLVAGLRGLGECGVTGDIALLSPLVDHPSASVRAAALRGLAQLQAGSVVDLAFAVLRDRSPAVIRAATEILVHSRRLTAETAWAGLLSAPAGPGRRIALQLVRALDHWERLAPLLKATSLDDPVASAAERAIEQWLRRNVRCFSRPTRTQVATITQHLASARIAIEFRREIAAVMASVSA